MIPAAISNFSSYPAIPGQTALTICTALSLAASRSGAHLRHSPASAGEIASPPPLPSTSVNGAAPSVVGQQQQVIGLPFRRRALMPRTAFLASGSIAPTDGIRVSSMVQSGGSRRASCVTVWRLSPYHLDRQLHPALQQLEPILGLPTDSSPQN